MPMLKVTYKSFLVVGAMCLSTVVQAETLRIEGLYPANEAGLETIRTISIEPFGGTDGGSLSFELEDRLATIVVDQQRYFDVVAARSSINPDAVLSGTVSVGIDEYETLEYRDRCVERNDKGKCVKRKSIEVLCDKRVVDYRAQIRMTQYSDGRTIYTRTTPNKNEQTVCRGDEDFKNSEAIIRGMIANTAQTVRRDIAPIERSQNIRILESRKGMDKASSKYFKAAIKMTKSDETEACRMWEEGAASGMVHVSLSFNRGLCAEQAGDLEQAMAFYQEATQFGARKTEIAQSQSRLSDRMRARDEWDSRNAVFQNDTN